MNILFSPIGTLRILALFNMNQTNSVFCTGPGRVMLPGFQTAINGAPCILFLFTGWNVNSPVKYAFAIIAAFLMGILNEGLSLFRKRLAIWLNEKNDFFKIFISLIYGIQLVFAYWMMLLVMTYEVGLFIALIFGLTIGNFLFSLKILQSKSEKQTVLPGGTTPCCNHESDTQVLIQKQ